ncbi:hypothetical protein K458DRAFT_381789 [Lentithecium fluviatile CBS 122367]|uniref:Uncharacterized protein n=1 Tax=Lentithecium fluviatile CBS 122367 TaxID=1168545 RepID=A0A6G1JPA7_9PLEO|nr:hypothetical protein K458DRAFT_381789 [Lentithecium fluviatile CBS 122367]
MSSLYLFVLAADDRFPDALSSSGMDPKPRSENSRLDGGGDNVAARLENCFSLAVGDDARATEPRKLFAYIIPLVGQGDPYKLDVDGAVRMVLRRSMTNPKRLSQYGELPRTRRHVLASKEATSLRNGGRYTDIFENPTYRTLSLAREVGKGDYGGHLTKVTSELGLG